MIQTLKDKQAKKQTLLDLDEMDVQAETTNCINWLYFLVSSSQSQEVCLSQATTYLKLSKQLILKTSLKRNHIHYVNV